jgi:inner membrane protein
MDNISHAVVSLVSGELLHRSLPEESSSESQDRRQKLILFTAVAAGNFPDLDLFLYGLLEKPLGYLLHHRGHSHTLAGVLLESILLFALVWAAWPKARKLLRESPVARRGFGFAMLIGFALHLSMDGLNSYGIHPFYPFYSGWFYGDLVFIVEPVFWVAFGVSAAFLTKRQWLRLPLNAVVCGFPAYAFSRGLLPWPSFFVLVVIAFTMAVLQSREPVRGRRALATAWAIGLLFVVLQGFASSRARALVANTLHAKDPDAVLLDDALTGSPSNPMCWSFVTIEKTNDNYRLRNGTVSIFPTLLRPENCVQIFGQQSEWVALGEDLLQTHEDTASLIELRELYKVDCRLQAWMRFARMPLVTANAASDLRFARGLPVNFTTMKLSSGGSETCSGWIPPWEPPRGDLLK